MKILLNVFYLLSLLSFPLLASYSEGKVDVSAYPKADMLISAEEAVKLIDSKNVMFVSGDSADSYLNNHIRGSVEMYAHHIHHTDITGIMPCAPLYRCIDNAEEFIGHAGIDNDTMVIAYDDFKGPNATGVYSFLKSLGHNNVKVLMGGWKAIALLDPNVKEIKGLDKAAKKQKKLLKKARKELGAFKQAEKRLKVAIIIRNEKKIAKYSAIVDKGPLSALQIIELEEHIVRGLAKVKKIEVKIRNMAAVVSTPKASKEQIKKIIAEINAHAKVSLSDDAMSEAITHHLVADSIKEEGVVAKHFRIDKKKINYTSIAGKEEVLHAVHDILKKGKKSKYIIIDARSMAEIIGERKMDHVARGGHVPGATFLEWKHISDSTRGVAFKTAKELSALFKKFGLKKNKTIYAYCHVGTGRSSEVITALELMGYKHAKVYTGSWDEWGNDMMLPIKR